MGTARIRQREGACGTPRASNGVLHRLPLLALLPATALAACGDPAGPGKSDRQEYALVAVNGAPIPAIAVEGTCMLPSFWYSAVYPDSIGIESGRLILEHGRYELYYRWRGETDACTTSHALWHRFSGGTYETEGDALVFTEGEASDTVSGWTGRSPGRPSGQWDSTYAVLVSWGALKLEYSRW